MALLEFLGALCAVSVAGILAIDRPISLTSAAGLTWGALVFVTAVFLSATAVRLYDVRARGPAQRVVARVAAAAALALALSAIAFYLMPGVALPRSTLITATALWFLGTLALRTLLLEILDRLLPPRNVLVIGAGRRAAAIRHHAVSKQCAFRVVGFVDVEGAERVVPRGEVLDVGDSLFAAVRKSRIGEVVVALDDGRGHLPIQDLIRCRLTGVAVLDVITFLERETGTVRSDLLTPSWLIFSGGFDRPPWRERVARAVDLAFGSAALLLFAPVLTALWIRRKFRDGLRAPLFCSVPSEGKDGTRFGLMQFDSRALPRALARKGARRLPMLVNVLRGDMSLVGPRPEHLDDARDKSVALPLYRERYRVKPGVTGWADVHLRRSARAVPDERLRLDYDLYYVKHRKLSLDFVILLHTIGTLLTRHPRRS